LPYLDGGVTKNKAVGLAAERQYKFIEGLKGSEVTRTGHGSDFEVKGLFAATPRLVEVKTGNAVLSPLQRSTGPDVVRPNPFLNSAVAAGLGVAGGVVSAATITRLVKENLEVTCGACGARPRWISASARIAAHLSPAVLSGGSASASWVWGD